MISSAKRNGVPRRTEANMPFTHIENSGGSPVPPWIASLAVGMELIDEHRSWLQEGNPLGTRTARRGGDRWSLTGANFWRYNWFGIRDRKISSYHSRLAFIALHSKSTQKVELTSGSWFYFNQSMLIVMDWDVWEDLIVYLVLDFFLHDLADSGRLDNRSVVFRVMERILLLCRGMMTKVFY